MPMRDRVFVIVTLVIAYGGFYLCRANVESSYPLLATAFGFTKTQLGLLSSIPIACYAVGKLVMGALGDVIGGRRLILLGIFGSVLATFAFGASGSLSAFVVLASLNRLLQSGGWSGVVSVVAERFDRTRHGFVMGVLSTSYELGNVAALLLCGAITAALPGWRPLFIINPTLFAAVGIFVALALKDVPAHGAPVAPRSERAVLVELAKRPAFWVVALLSSVLTFLRIGFLTWTPTYIYEVSAAAGQRAISGSIAKSAIFPAAGVVAALSVGALSDRFGPGRRAPVMAASLAVVVVLVLVLAHGHVRSPVVATCIIGGVGLFLLGPYSLLAGAMALDVSSKRGAATASGAIDSAGYIGATAAGVLLGRAVDVGGWPAAFDVVAGAAVVATVVAGAWAVVVGRANPARHRP
jgi:sugar phosphate permease